MQYFKKVCDMHCIYDDIEKKPLYYILVCDWTLQTAASVSANQISTFCIFLFQTYGLATQMKCDFIYSSSIT